MPSVQPSLQIGSLIIQFASTFTYENISVSQINGTAIQEAALDATAVSFGYGVRLDQLEYINATAVTDVNSISCDVRIVLTVPVQQVGTSSVAEAWVDLTSSLTAAVSSGAYTETLLNASVS